jgi:ARID/BRIGHT DNA binding domain
MCSTFLQAEPVLGGKKLDLLKIWQRVQEAGGFEQVSAIAC